MGRTGKTEHIITPTRRYLHNIHHVDKILGQEQESEKRKRICYIRVSSAKQKDLQRQVQKFREQYPEHEIIQDICSGINFQRKGFKNLVDQICGGMVLQIVVIHKDSLCRFEYDLLEQVCSKFQTELLFHSANEHSEECHEEELFKDLLSIINVFVAKTLEGMVLRTREEEKQKIKEK